ncbi:CBASS cGAMP synthase [Billgrantia sp. LNSP4103-1]|uniref:CBASS cGAMP synthase n=1 Tax=Billgrantia sp. LNSP4103-1 TaxID=3410266 RepID=UPI00403F7203
MLNLSPLLFTTKDSLHEDGRSLAPPTFLKALDLSPEEKKSIDVARKEIRDALREGLPAALREKGYTGRVCEPKFYIQGSWAYKTLNRPCQTPPQQSDVDDGVYLPLSIMKEETKPHLAIDDFYAAVMEVLQPLCNDYGWELKRKATCMRVVISHYAHIDLPLYAIPDEQYLILKAAMEERNVRTLDSIAATAATQTWKRLPSDQILLACDRGWIKSDPLSMKEWFEQEVQDKGQQLRRVIRYIKGFRDQQWDEKGPSSIFLMAAACPLFELEYKRDDEALLTVLKGMPQALRDGVLSPIDQDVYLTAALSEEEIEAAAEKFEMFAKYLEAAMSLSASAKEQACRWMREMLGDRFPNRPDLIDGKPSGLPAAIAAVEPEPSELEILQRSKSG